MKLSLVLIVISLTLVACSSEPTDSVVAQPSSPATPGNPEDSVSAMPTAPSDEPQSAPETNVQKISMTVDEFSWNPSKVTVKAGTTVELTVTNVGDKAHGLGMPGLNVNLAVAPGETKTVTFVADNVGSNRFFCNVPCGSGHSSMTGIFVVE